MERYEERAVTKANKIREFLKELYEEDVSFCLTIPTIMKPRSIVNLVFKTDHPLMVDELMRTAYWIRELDKQAKKKEKRNMIHIKTKKEINHLGEEGRKIKSLQALTFTELPPMYKKTDTDPYFYLTTLKDAEGKDFRCFQFMNCPEVECLMQGVWYEESEFQQILDQIKFCGQRLHDINEIMAEAKRKWNGEEVFKF